MGFSLSWLAVKGKPAQAALAELGFRPTGKREEVAESDLCGAELPNGWYLILSNHTETVATEATMQKLCSPGVELVTCFVEEHVNVSSASSWREGRQIWSVVHDHQMAETPDTEGDPPSQYKAILDDLTRQQREADEKGEDVDYLFDLPVEIARSVTGYRHDEDIPGMSGEVYEVLEGHAPAGEPEKKSFFKKLFGG